MKFVIINNQLLEAAKAVISVEDRGFRYGDSVFETIAVHAGVPFRFDWHMERLRKGLHAVRITANLHTLHEQCRRLLKENNLSDGLLRVQVSRGIGSRGYLPDPKHPKAGAVIVIETLPLPVLPDGPVTLWLSSYAKISPRSLPVQYKLGQGLNSTLARIEANEQGCFDALMLNEHGQVCETGAGNIFWLKNGELYTPSLTCGALEGSMRAAIMELSEMTVHEVSATLDSVLAADTVMICNVAWKLLAVGALKPGKHTWKSHFAYCELRAHIDRHIADYIGRNNTRW